MKFSYRTAIAAMGFAVWASGVQGGSLFSPGGVETIHFTNYEDIFDSTGHEVPSTVTVNPGGATVSGTAAQAAPGDILIGVLQVSSPVQAASGAVTLTDTITGVFALQVTNVLLPGTTINAGATVGGLLNSTGSAIVLSDPFVSYAPLTAAQAALTFTADAANGGTSVHLPSGFGTSSGEEFAFYKNTLANAGTASGDLASSYNTFVPGVAPYFTLGTTTNGYFYSDVTNAGGPRPTIASYAGLNFILNPGIVDTPISNSISPFFATTVTDMSVNNNVFANTVPLTGNAASGSDGLLSPWDFQSTDPAKINIVSVVSLPSAGLTGAALLIGLGGMALLRRRKNAMT